MNVEAEFLTAFARDRAEQVVDTPGGFAVLSPRRFPHAYDHNCLYVTGPVDPAALLAAADQVLAAFTHRQIEDLAHDEATARGLSAAGYAREDDDLLTLRRGPDADRPAADGVTVLTLDQRIDFADRVWGGDYDENDPAVRRELAERARSATNAAQCTFLGVVGPDGVEASCDLFVRGDVAQVEEVATLTPFRGRGHASRLVRAAAELAQADAPTRTVFIAADSADWPRLLYGRLGFDVTGRRTVWRRDA